MATYRWDGNKLIDIEDKPKMLERWTAEDKLFNVGDKVIVLDKRDYETTVGCEWDARFDKHIGRTRTIKRRIVNYYGYISGYQLKNCPGIYSPDFLVRKENAKCSV